MYPLLCAGGYPVPEKEGQFEIVGIDAVPTVAGSAMECTLRDHWSANWDNDPDRNKHEVISLKTDGNSSCFHVFQSPIKTRRGLRATTLTNCTRAIVYLR